tara:strand:+ start:123 stop:251 length:129 start_codon:yes stop_codon:yes gene_type:complete
MVIAIFLNDQSQEAAAIKQQVKSHQKRGHLSAEREREFNQEQ